MREISGLAQRRRAFFWDYERGTGQVDHRGGYFLARKRRPGVAIRNVGTTHSVGTGLLLLKDMVEEPVLLEEIRKPWPPEKIWPHGIALS